MSVTVGRAGGTVIVNRDRAINVVVARTDAVKVGGPGVQGPRGARGADGAGQVAPHAFGWGDAPQPVFTAPAAGILTLARLQFTEAFTDPGAVVEVGTVAAPGAAMPAVYNSPATVLEFENSPDLPLAAGEAVWLRITPGTSVQGAGLLFLTFLPTA